MELFQTLGEKVESIWKENNYDENEFSDIASSVIEEMDFCGIDVWEINRWIHKSEKLPSQNDSEVTFSDLPITVFSSEQFFIEIYFWLNSTTTIHQHSFAGAFQVLRGSSLHSLYKFEKKVDVNMHMALGDINLHSFEFLEQGAIRKIPHGDKFIHSLFHLDRPSITLTVRTYGLPSAQPQFDYRKPSLAIDPFFKPDTVRKKCESVSLLLQIDHPDTQTLICELLEEADLFTTYSILKIVANEYCNHPLERLFNLTKKKDRFDNLVFVAREKHGKSVDLLISVIEEEARQRDITKRRSQINKLEHRFFMALLLNLQGRERILDAVKQRFPNKDSIDLVLSWIKELLMIKTIGSHEPNVLNLSDFNERNFYILEELLKGIKPEKITSQTEENVVNLCNKIRSNSVLSSLFED